MLKEAGILFAITLIAGLLLGFVYELTKGPIRLQEEKAVQEACQAVFTDAGHFEELDPYIPSDDTAQNLSDTGITIGTVYEAQDASGEKLGYVIQTTSSEGYGGNIVLYVGIRLDGTVNDISILSISETPGLGMKAGDVLVPQFHQKNVKSFTYTKTGSTSDSEIDAISGATITTRAVTNAVNGMIMYREVLAMNKAGERLYNGIIKENPTFVLMLGMCPTLAVTTSAMNGLGMGLTTAVVLTMSNLIISLLRKVIPSRVRIPAFIVIIASFVTAVQLLLQAYLPSLNDALGVYIPLIVVNCIILGRAESYAYSNPPIPSLFDGLGMGLGFSLALTCIGAVREILAAGSVFGFRIMPDSYVTINIFGLAPGAFFVLAALTALQNYVKNKRKLAGKDYEKIQSGCGHDCLHCGESGCSERFYDNTDTSEDAVMDAARAAAKPKAATDDLETIDLDKEDK